MIKRLSIIVILLSAMFFSFAQSTINIYVSPDGAGDGTTDAAPTTLAAALAQIEAATVSEATNYKINLADGNYTGSEVAIHQRENKNITVEAQSTGAVMQHNIVIYGSLRGGSAQETLSIRGLNFDGAVLRCATSDEEAHTYIHNVTVDGCDFQNGTTWAISFGPSQGRDYNVVIRNCSVSNNNTGFLNIMPTNLLVENCQITNAPRVANLTGGGSDYEIIFRNCTMTGITKYGIRTSSTLTPPATIENCTLSSATGCAAADEGLVVLRGANGCTINRSTLTAVESTSKTINVCHETPKVTLKDTVTISGGVIAELTEGAIIGENADSKLVLANGATYGAIPSSNYVWDPVTEAWGLPPFTEVYVSPNGAGDGLTPEQPTTIQNAFDMIRSTTVSDATNYTVFMANGDYTGANAEISQQANKNIEVRAMNPASASCNMALNFVIDGNGRSSNAETVTLKHLTFTGTNQIAGGVVDDGLGTDLAHCYPHNITVDSCTFTNTTVNYVINFQAKCSVTSFALKNSTFTGCSHCLQTAGGGSGFTIDNCTFTNCQRGFNWNHARNITISNTTMTGFTKYAVRSGQGTGTPVHGETTALRMNNCTISGEPASGEDLFVLRGDCSDVIADHVTVTATGSNPSVLNVRADSKIYVADDTLAVTGTITGTGTIDGTDWASALLLGAGTTYGAIPSGNYRWNVNLKQWTVPDSWYYVGEAQPALVYVDDVCEISTPEQLARLTYEINSEYDVSYNKTYKLTADIDLAGHEWCPLGVGCMTDYGFGLAVFDGQGHTIKNMTITDNSPHLDYDNAFIGYDYGSEIKNLKFEDVNIHLTRAALAQATYGTQAATVVGTAVATGIENIEVVSGTLYTECVLAAGVVGSFFPYTGGYNYMKNIVNRATVTGHTTSPGCNYYFLSGIVGHLSCYYTNGGNILMQKCANYGEIKVSNPYQMLAEDKIAAGNKFAWTIGSQIVAQSDYTESTYVVFDSCVAAGTFYGSPYLTNNGGTLTETGRGVFQGRKWTGVDSYELYGYEYVNNGSGNDFYIGNETVYYTDKNTEDIFTGIENNEFTTSNHSYLNGSNKNSWNAADKKAFMATRAFISNATAGTHKFVFKGSAITGDTLYGTWSDARSHVGTDRTIYLVSDQTLTETSYVNAEDTLVVGSHVTITIPASIAFVVDGKLEANSTTCVGTDNTSVLIVTGKCNATTDGTTGIYLWDATETKWAKIEE